MIKGVTKEVRLNYYIKIVDKYQDFFNKYRTEIKKLIESNSAPLQSDNSTLDILPFNSIPIMNKTVKVLINKGKSSPILKKHLLFVKRILFKK